MKKIIYILLFICFVFFIISCDNNKDRVCKYSGKEKKEIEQFIKYGPNFYMDNSDIVVKLAPEKDFKKIIRVQNDWRNITQTLSIYGNSDFYIMQYITTVRNIKSGKTKLNMFEKVLTKNEAKEIFSQAKKLKCLPLRLNPKQSIIDTDIFSLTIKDDKDIISFYGLSDFYYLDKESKIVYSYDKEKVLGFCGKLFKMAGVGHGIKSLYLENQKGDTIEYSLGLINAPIVKNLSFFINGKEIQKNTRGLYKFKISSKDTLNLIDKIRVRETQWDGEIIEY